MINSPKDLISRMREDTNRYFVLVSKEVLGEIDEHQARYVLNHLLLNETQFYNNIIKIKEEQDCFIMGAKSWKEACDLTDTLYEKLLGNERISMKKIETPIVLARNTFEGIEYDPHSTRNIVENRKKYENMLTGKSEPVKEACASHSKPKKKAKKKKVQKELMSFRDTHTDEWFMLVQENDTKFELFHQSNLLETVYTKEDAMIRMAAILKENDFAKHDIEVQLSEGMDVDSFKDVYGKDMKPDKKIKACKGAIKYSKESRESHKLVNPFEDTVITEEEEIDLSIAHDGPTEWEVWWEENQDSEELISQYQDYLDEMAQMGISPDEFEVWAKATWASGEAYESEEEVGKEQVTEAIECAYCGAKKEEDVFVIGASNEPEWTMVEGTGKMACPDCYEKASAEGQAAIKKATGLESKHPVKKVQELDIMGGLKKLGKDIVSGVASQYSVAPGVSDYFKGTPKSDSTQTITKISGSPEAQGVKDRTPGPEADWVQLLNQDVTITLKYEQGITQLQGKVTRITDSG